MVKKIKKKKPSENQPKKKWFKTSKWAQIHVMMSSILGLLVVKKPFEIGFVLSAHTTQPYNITVF